MHVIGTAGHVDHGKSTLVQALTGIDPDRLAEEKRRGLTIDLGFAWLPLPSGREVGIVDVPGHERFIKNMLAGAGAINVTMFVVAANEGWKPQSQEHLDILDLLGVNSAIFVVTKKDLVDRAKLSWVFEDIRARISATSLSEAPIHSVSVVTGEGIPEMLELLTQLLDMSPPAPDLGRPRLWIDRVFSMHGSGTVITGTLVEGRLHQNAEVEILPQHVRARIRTIQSHRKQVTTIGPGNRTALNLVGLETAQMTRGDVIVLPGSWMPTRRIATSLRFLPHLDHEPTEKGAFKFYVGSAERGARIRFVSSQGQKELFGLIDLDAPAVIGWGDRFVLRDSGRRETLGGGVVLEPHADRLRGPTVLERLKARTTQDQNEYARVVLQEANFLPRKDLMLRTGIRPEDAELLLSEVWTDDFVIDESFLQRIGEELREEIGKHHEANPLDPGMTLSAARNSIDLDPRFFDQAVEELRSRKILEIENGFLRLPGFAPAVGGAEHDRLVQLLNTAGASPPTIAELQQTYDPALIRAVVRAGDAVQISPQIIFSKQWLEKMKHEIRARVESHGPFTVAEFRDLAGTTRKYAIPLLEHLDAIGFTKRAGDKRVFGPRSD